jgi:hypothetical protein
MRASVRSSETRGIHSVPASGTLAIAAASTVRAQRSSGSSECTSVLPARAREHLQLERHRVEEVVDALGRLVDVQALAKLGILCRHAHRAAACMAVVALPRRHADVPS